MREIKSIKLVYEKENLWNSDYLENFFQYLGIYVWKEVLTVSNREQGDFDIFLYVGEKSENLVKTFPKNTIFLEDFIKEKEITVNLYTWDRDRLQKLLLELIKTIFEESYLDKDQLEIFQELITIYLTEELAKHSATLSNKLNGEFVEIGERAFLNSYQKIQNLENKYENSNYHLEYAKLHSALSTNEIHNPGIGYFLEDDLSNGNPGLFSKLNILSKKYPYWRNNILLRDASYCVARSSARSSLGADAQCKLNNIMLSKDNKIYMPVVLNLYGNSIITRFLYDTTTFYSRAIDEKQYSGYYYNMFLTIERKMNKHRGNNKGKIEPEEIKPIIESSKKYFQILKDEIPKDEIYPRAMINQYNVYHTIALFMYINSEYVSAIHYANSAEMIYNSIDNNPYFDWIWGDLAESARKVTKRKLNIENLYRIIGGAYSLINDRVKADTYLDKSLSFEEKVKRLTIDYKL